MSSKKKNPTLEQAGAAVRKGVNPGRIALETALLKIRTGEDILAVLGALSIEGRIELADRQRMRAIEEGDEEKQAQQQRLYIFWEHELSRVEFSGDLDPNTREEQLDSNARFGVSRRITANTADTVDAGRIDYTNLAKLSDEVFLAELKRRFGQDVEFTDISSDLNLLSELERRASTIAKLKSERVRAFNAVAWAEHAQAFGHEGADISRKEINKWFEKHSGKALSNEDVVELSKATNFFKKGFRCSLEYYDLPPEPMPKLKGKTMTVAQWKAQQSGQRCTVTSCKENNTTTADMQFRVRKSGGKQERINDLEFVPLLCLVD